MELLTPALGAGARTSSDARSRVVWTSSSGSYFGIHNLDLYKPSPARDKRAAFDIYNDSKLANVVVAREAARRYADKDIVVTSVNPGNLRTELTRYTTPLQLWFIVSARRARLEAATEVTCWQSKIQFPAAYGALPQLYAGTSPETRDANGKVRISWHVLRLHPHLPTVLHSLE
jgi:retinol dehydrogenase-12